jgi:hypothetical protein
MIINKKSCVNKEIIILIERKIIVIKNVFNICCLNIEIMKK